MRYQWTLILIVGLGMGLSGCLDSDDDDDNGNGEEVGDGWPELQGVWQSNCFVVPGEDGASDAPQIQTVDIDGDRAEVDAAIYDETDTTCAGATIVEASIVWRYEVGEEITTSGGVTAREIDVEVVEDPADVTDFDEEFDIFHINDDGNTLYFSADAAPRSEDRPDTLDFDRPYTKISD